MLDVLIADDEPLARQTIKLLLKDQDIINDVFEASDGSQAIEVFEKHKPDIVFLDIQMPGMTGLEVASKLPDTTAIIFATAYDQHAITAFELNAIGYLLKPFDDERFYTAFNRAKKQIAERKTGPNYQKINQLIHEIAEEQDRQYKTRLVVKDPGRIRLIETEDINFISGAGNYAEIHLLDDKMLLHRETLTSLEKQLDPHLFVRIHRSTIVRRNSVSELRPNENGDYCVILKSGEKLTLSRRNKAKLEELIGDD
ncbi:LytR/AlgR family response regulator transcription factor [Thalassotalea atypica]|uniref:LytR/AlgR family response regulator transcription factor n=1 Tax=Thalassotalea atypica TaxID=2054316 RepID=UPI002573305F|nr:LytTR family DNA-binding domain-containing protein [Thalassotalea atypica]